MALNQQRRKITLKPNYEHAQRERDVFSSNLKRILVARGKTQADISADLDITSSTVSDWANAKKYPRVDKMQALADYLGVLISDLREETPTPVAEGGPSDHELIKLWTSLSPDEILRMKDFALGMIASRKNDTDLPK